MAGNSSVFYLRQQINESNIKEWQNWSVDINYVVEQFNDVVSNLVNRLDLAEMTIDALMTKIDNSNVNYVKTQYDSIQIYSSDKITYSQPCGVFSNTLSGENIVYVYANKSIPGLYFDDKELQAIVNTVENTTTTSDTDEEDIQHEAVTNIYLPFAQFSGSDAGTLHIIKTMNAAKIKGDVKLYFSLYSELESYDENYTTALSVNINYSGVITKSLYTIDKSSLGKALVKNAAVASETLPVQKYGVSYGQFSTTKTVANIAAKKTNRIE